MSKKPNIFFLIQLANRYAIAQDFIMHDALLRGKSSLDQLALGLDAVKVLHLIRLFPEEFEDLFTYHSPTVLTPEYILELLEFPVQMNEEERRTADMFREFIGSCSDQGWFCIDYRDIVWGYRAYCIYSRVSFSPFTTTAASFKISS